MKVAMISTPFEATPPVRYGGTERIVSLLTEGLVGRGHSVDLFATGDSSTTSNLTSFFEKPFRPYNPAALVAHVVQSFRVIQEGRYDIVHNHAMEYAFLSYFSNRPMLTTMHNDGATDWAVPMLQAFADLRYVAVSDKQAFNLRQIGVDVAARIYCALDLDKYSYSYKEGRYLAFLGNMVKRKGAHNAILTAKKCGIPLKIGGKTTDPEAKEYFDGELRPHIDGKFIEFLGELNDQEKIELLKNASALLFPIEWEEPFGMVMMEAMACGTPVIGFNRGSVPEVVRHMTTGFVVDNADEMVEAVARIGEIDRRQCRKNAVDRFDAKAMVLAYERLYERILQVA